MLIWNLYSVCFNVTLHLLFKVGVTVGEEKAEVLFDLLMLMKRWLIAYRKSSHNKYFSLQSVMELSILGGSELGQFKGKLRFLL